MKRYSVLVTVIFLFSAIDVIAQAQKASNDTKPTLAVELEQLYIKYLDSARKGDVKAVLALMTSDMAEMAAAITPELVKGMSSTELDPRQVKFVQIDVVKKSARLVYQHNEKEKKAAQAIVFKSEKDQWKIAKIFTSRTDSSTKKDALQEVLNDSQDLLK